MTEPTSAIDVVTLVIAIVALVLACASFGWQVLQHILTGPRVRVELLWGGMGADRVVTGPVSGDLDAFKHAGVSTFIFSVKGRNRGRYPMDVTGFAIDVEGSGAYCRAGWAPNPPLPHRLEAGSEVAFYIPLEDIEVFIHGIGDNYRGRLRGRLDLASGSSPCSDWATFPTPARP